MAHANLPISFWGDALLAATYILNRVPSKSVASTPYELWAGRRPVLDHLRPWGSTGYVRIPSQQLGKLDPRGRKGIFIRYPENSKGYVMICELPDGGLTEIESRNVDFIEHDFPSRGDVRKDLELYDLTESQEVNAPILSEGRDLQPIPMVAEDSGSKLPPSGSSPLEDDDSEDPLPHRTQRVSVPRRRFEIEGETFMCGLREED